MSTETPRTPSKKSQILSLYALGVSDVGELSLLTQARPSYIANVLQDAGELKGYYDLYTPQSRQQNIYARFFAGKVGFRDLETATRSLDLIDRLYRQFAATHDRAGQHHALTVALTLCNRARWSGKPDEAAVFARWLISRLQHEDADESVTPHPGAVEEKGAASEPPSATVH